ncbi:MAG: hypothetical protein M3252_04110 [Actinomycetota bacterium]|nr:hypothetical protein [Actinomycetota bacterium]
MGAENPRCPLELPGSSGDNVQVACGHVDLNLGRQERRQPQQRVERCFPRGREFDVSACKLGQREPRLGSRPCVSARALRADAVVEIGELVAGSHPGRRDHEHLTIYKSVGIAVQDAAAAAVVLAAAARVGAGVEVAL